MKDVHPPVKAERSASDKSQRNPPDSFLGTENPRLLRAIQALSDGPCTRSEIDAAAGASNGPEVISQLRRRGLTVPCELVDAVDRDGLPVKRGVYRFTYQDHQKVKNWKESLAMSAQDSSKQEEI